MKKLLQAALLSVLTASVLLVGSSAFSAASADTNFGLVDLEKIYSNFEKAKGVIADIKVKQAELQKMQADFVKQLEDTKKNQPKNPVASSQLETDLSEKLNAKVKEYRDWTSAKQKEIDTDVETMVNRVAKDKKFDVVLTKQAVFQGGTDITNEVLGRLNSNAQ
ncbi:MAG: OmpH family outer membrane protein [Cyanobacteria bacterium]|nr:OmpH family outer membrane protein [Cyanobacteriota bacterium]